MSHEGASKTQPAMDHKTRRTRFSLLRPTGLPQDTGKRAAFVRLRDAFSMSAAPNPTLTKISHQMARAVHQVASAKKAPSKAEAGSKNRHSQEPRYARKLAKRSDTGLSAYSVKGGYLRIFTIYRPPAFVRRLI